MKPWAASWLTVKVLLRASCTSVLLALVTVTFFGHPRLALGLATSAATRVAALFIAFLLPCRTQRGSIFYGPDGPCISTTVVPVVCHHLFGQLKVVTYNRWSFIASKDTKNKDYSVTQYVVTNGRWSLTAVVTYSRYYCTNNPIVDHSIEKLSQSHQRRYSVVKKNY